jgi:hypothetical protein
LRLISNVSAWLNPRNHTFAPNFFLCVLGCFVDLGFDLSAGCVLKSVEKARKGLKRTKKVGKVL